MKKTVILFLALFNLGVCSILVAQNEKPKIALVLSGGGAKGVAHIPVLQALDSLHIVPDIIIGTSMGSVVGGLYAMGYSGDEIADLIKTTEWNNLLYEKTPFNDVTVEEKSEYEKYLIGLDIFNGADKTTAYLLNDQNLRLKIALLSAPFRKDMNFDDLPIPFRSVTTDIVNLKEIVINEGSVAKAMRASMSIPGVFEPVKYKNTILLDGGILNNFPTNIAKNWGADIIIGSDVSGAAEDSEGLNNISTLLFQTAMLQNFKIYPSNRALCDIVIDHVPHLTYSTGDFNKTTELYEEGKMATNEKIGELTVLSHKISSFPQKKVALPAFKDSFEFSNISYKNVSTANLQLLKSRIGLEPHRAYSSEDLGQAVKRSMGTDIFRKIYFDFNTNNQEEEELEITGHEKSKHRLNASIHYDLYRGVGLIGNYTGRNILGAASRVLVTLDIAEQPKAMVQAQKNFGQKKDWWWRSEGIAKQLTQRVFINGQYADDFKEKSIKFRNQINKNINSLSSYVGLGLNYEYLNIDPLASTELRDNLLLLNQYYASYLGFDAHFQSNTLDKVFYPRTGSSFNAILNRSITQRVSVLFSEAQNLTGLYYGFTNLQANYHKRLPLVKKVTGILEASMGFTFADKDDDNEISFYNAGFPQLFSLGGNLPLQRINTVGFQGLQEDEVIASQFILVKLASQFNVFNNFYISPNVNIASIGFSDLEEFSKHIFNPKGSWQVSDQTSLLLSIGTMVSYKSLLGPVDLSMSWTNDINKVRLFLSVGIPFNR